MIRKALTAGSVGIALGSALGYAQAPIVYHRTSFTEAQQDHLVRYCIHEEDLPTSMVSQSGTMRKSQTPTDAVVGYARAGDEVAVCLMAYDTRGKRFEMSLLPVTTTTVAQASKETLRLINVNADTCVIVASTSNGVERSVEDDPSPMYVVNRSGLPQPVLLQTPVSTSLMECHLDRGDTFTVTLMGKNDERQDIEIGPTDWKKPDGSPADVAVSPRTNPADQSAALSGDVVALNQTLGQKEESDTIEAAPGDEVTFRLTLNNGSDRVVEGALLYPRFRQPVDVEPRGRVLDFVVSKAGVDEGSRVEGVQLELKAPESDNCASDSSFSVDGLSVDGARLVQHTSWSGTAQEGVDTLAPVELPPIDPGEKLVITGNLDTSGPNRMHQISGTSVEFRVVPAEDGIGHSEDYSQTGDVKIGDTVRALIGLHNGSCSSGEALVNVRASVGPFDTKTGSIRLSAVSYGKYNVDPPRTKLSPAVILTTDSVPATLEPIEGTTKLFGLTCNGAQLIEELPDWLFRVGVGVSVPGYIPRMTCESHMRYVSTDLRVVPAGGR